MRILKTYRNIEKWQLHYNMSLHVAAALIASISSAIAQAMNMEY